MKKDEKKKIHDLSADQLAKRILNAHKSAQKMKITIAAGKQKNTGAYKKLRQEIARLLTAQNELKFKQLKSGEK